MFIYRKLDVFWVFPKYSQNGLNPQIFEISLAESICLSKQKGLKYVKYTRINLGKKGLKYVKYTCINFMAYLKCHKR